MATGKYIFSRWQLALVLLAGTVIRLLYGYYSRPWLGAPDQLAWELGIDEMLSNGSWRYVQLIHAPHEGGSVLLGFFSLIFRAIPTIIPPLSLAALFVDLAVRYIQVKVTQRVFGKEAARWFGIWTILAVPAMLPWSVINFGLHSLSSVFPFLLVYIIHRYRKNNYLSIISGLICALAVSFSYDSLILVLACLVCFLFSKKDIKEKYAVPKFLFAFALGMIPHVLIRVYTENNSLLQGNVLLPGRGLSVENLLSAISLKNLLTVWFTSLPGSFLVASWDIFLMISLAAVICLLLLSGIAFFLKRTTQYSTKLIMTVIVFLFMILYGMGPFNSGRLTSNSYMSYRHLCYIIPLLSVMVLTGFAYAGKLKKYLLTIWIVLCGSASILYMTGTKKRMLPEYRPTGWILINKYGNDTRFLVNTYSIADTCCRHELLIGYGWGLSANMLAGKTDSLSVQKMLEAVRQYPGQYRPLINQGIRYSFTKGITPVLDRRLLGIFEFFTKQQNPS